MALNSREETGPQLRRMPEEVPHAAGVVQPRGDAQRAQAVRVRVVQRPLLAAGKEQRGFRFHNFISDQYKLIT